MESYEVAKDVQEHMLAVLDAADNVPSMYAGREAAGEVLTPHERMYAMYLQRLEGHLVTFVLTELPGLGYVDYDESPANETFRFAFVDLMVNGWSRRFQVRLRESGVVCDVVLDLFSRLVTVVPQEDVGAHRAGDALLFTLAGFFTSAVSAETATSVKLWLGVEVVPYTDDVDAAMTPLRQSFTPMYVELGVIRESRLDDGYVPGRKLSMQDVSRVTGVPASRLSELRSGALDYNRMSHGNVSLLCAYGALSALSGDVFEGLKMYYRYANVHGTASITVTTTDGAVYVRDGLRTTIVDAYRRLIEQLGGVSVALDGFMSGDEPAPPFEMARDIETTSFRAL